MSKSTLINNQAGFTLVELMLAMSLFVAVMVISTAGFIGMNRTFTRGTIRKQLSEAVQRTTEDVSRTVRSMPQSANEAPFCPASPTPSPVCPKESDWNTICLTGTRYFWKNDAGGLYKDLKLCTKPIDISQSEELLNDRYKVANLEITPSDATNLHLYTVSGVFRTADDAAFDSLSATKCKGSAQGSASRSCALEQFNTTINVRGSTVTL